MTTHATDDTADLPAEPPVAAGLELEDGGLLVYDPENASAWLQSDCAVLLDGYR